MARGIYTETTGIADPPGRGTCSLTVLFETDGMCSSKCKNSLEVPERRLSRPDSAHPDERVPEFVEVVIAPAERRTRECTSGSHDMFPIGSLTLIMDTEATDWKEHRTGEMEMQGRHGADTHSSIFSDESAWERDDLQRNEEMSGNKRGTLTHDVDDECMHIRTGIALLHTCLLGRSTVSYARPVQRPVQSPGSICVVNDVRFGLMRRVPNGMTVDIGANNRTHASSRMTMTVFSTCDLNYVISTRETENIISGKWDRTRTILHWDSATGGKLVKSGKLGNVDERVQEL
ncbi:hypothetical protein FISHEDRAFT_62141 [Fistulina hepatica ATCC 64428]|nr:hypothetical protein FISHEDRAFT_62141 [Fistulina hepatica ATCC 64428]